MYIKVILSREIRAEGPCGDSDDGHPCLGAVCHVQETLIPMAAAQEAVGTGRHSHQRTLGPPRLLNCKDESWADEITLSNKEHRTVLRLGIKST